MHRKDLDKLTVEEVEKKWREVCSGEKRSSQVRKALDTLEKMEDVDMETDVYLRKPSLEDFKGKPLYRCFRDYPEALENWVIVYRKMEENDF